MQSASSFDFSVYAKHVAGFIRSQLWANKDRAGVAGQMHLLTVAVERDLQLFGDERELARVACAPGCDACCVVNVAILVPEAITIAHYLLHHYPADLCNEISARLDDLSRKTRWLDDEERLVARKACAFLDRDGLCTIHKVRPLLCRSLSPLDGETCRNALTKVVLGEPPIILMNHFQKMLFDAAFKGLSNGLAQLGLDDRSWRLTDAISHLLRENDLVQRFLDGDRIVRH